MPDEITPIGVESGQSIRVVELIWIEDENRRRILTKDGKLLCDIHVLVEHAAPSHPALHFETVCEFSIQRFGHLHSADELRAIRAAVEKLGNELGRALKIVDTFGWSGEIALALYRFDHSDTITIVDDLTGDGRRLEPWSDTDEHRSMLYDNLGPILDTRIHHSPRDAATLPDLLTDEFDMVFIDTVATPERMMALLEGWMPRLSDGGMFIGVSKQFKDAVRSIGNSLEMEVPDGPAYVLPKAVIERWHQLEEHLV